MAGEDQFPELTKSHRETWEGFMTFTLWSGIVIVVILVLMAVFLV